MLNDTINKRIFRNISLGGLLISVLVGLVVYSVEHGKIDDYVGELAEDESAMYAGYYEDYYANPSEASFGILQDRVGISLGYDRFVLIEIYNEDIQRLIVECLPGTSGIKQDLETNFADFKMKGEIAHKKAVINEELYIKVMSPIRDRDSAKIIGHFEGIYHVNEAKIAAINRQIFFYIVQAMMITLVTTILLYPIIYKQNQKLALLSKELLHSNINTIKSLGNAIAKRDSDTNSHNYRVTIYAVELAERLQIGRRQMRALIKGAFLHDVGKIGISDAILMKPGKLTADEFATMKLHVTLGVEILNRNRWLEDAVDVVLFHHEKFDGNGYIQGLAGENIPHNARIFAIVDVFDALTSARPYKKAFAIDESLAIMQEGAGSHFDPQLLKIFGGLAQELYQQVNLLNNEQKLTKSLDRLIGNYFSVNQ